MESLIRNDTPFAQRRWKETLFALVVALILAVPWMPATFFIGYLVLLLVEERYNTSLPDEERRTLLAGLSLW